MSVIVLARIAVETTSPLAIYSGGRDLLASNALARDWNGNPYLPSTSLTGVWRSVIDTLNESAEWFGCLGSGKSDKNTRLASRIAVSDGMMLDSHSRLPGRVDNGVFHAMSNCSSDKLYQKLSAGECGYERTSCRINSRKANHSGSLFKNTMIPKGVRFAFDVKFDLDSRGDVDFCNKLMDCIGSESFTLGSKTANGFGTFRVIGRNTRTFVLEDYASDPKKMTEEIRSFIASRDVVIECNKHSDIGEDNIRTWDFILESEGTMRIGTGKKTDGLSIKGPDDRDIDLMKFETEFDYKNRNIQQCFTDSRLKWNGKEYDKEISEFIIPGSTIKGIIAHRTMFHFLRRKKWFADRRIREESDVRPQELVDKILENATPPEELEPFYQLFGKNDPSDHKKMLAGSLKVRDAVISCKGIINRMHNKIDRFTGAVMPSALFGQARLVDPSFRVHISLNRSRKNRPDDDSDIMKAFEDTIYDLKNGFLNICAGSGRDTAVFSEKKK